MNALYILQIMSTAVDLPDLDVHNLVNTVGIAFSIWYLKNLHKEWAEMKKDMHDFLIRLTKIETKDEVRNEDKR